MDCFHFEKGRRDVGQRWITRAHDLSSNERKAMLMCVCRKRLAILAKMVSRHTNNGHAASNREQHGSHHASAIAVDISEFQQCKR